MNPRRCGVIKRVVIRSWIDFLPGVDDRRTIIVLKESVLKLKWGRRTSPSGKRAKHLAIKKLNKGISQRYNTHHWRVNQPLTCSEFGTFKGSNSLSIIDLIYPQDLKEVGKGPGGWGSSADTDQSTCSWGGWNGSWGEHHGPNPMLIQT